MHETADLAIINLKFSSRLGVIDTLTIEYQFILKQNMKYRFFRELIHQYAIIQTFRVDLAYRTGVKRCRATNSQELVNCVSDNTFEGSHAKSALMEESSTGKSGR